MRLKSGENMIFYHIHYKTKPTNKTKKLALKPAYSEGVKMRIKTIGTITL